MREAGWSGMMSLPRVLNLDMDGTLRMRVLPQASGLRDGVVAVSRADGGLTSVLAKATGEVVCSGTKGMSFAFGLRADLGAGVGELLKVQYLGERHVFVADGKEMALEPGDLPTLHVYVDGSVIELIVGERIGYTKRFYYTEKTAPDVTAWTNGNDAVLRAWKVAPISKNRLTTPA